MKKTIYDLFEIAENATKEEIEAAYSKLVYDYRQDPSFDEATNKENEMIVNKLKIGYEILMDPQKRKAYDSKIAQERANDLLSQVPVSAPAPAEPEPEEVVEEKPVSTVKINEEKQKAIDNIEDDEVPNQEVNRRELTEEERKKIQDAAREEFDNNLERARQAEKEYKEAYTKAYNNYIKSEKKEVLKGKLQKVKTVCITIVVVIVTCFIMWLIPPIRKMLIGLYNDYAIVRIIVDLIKGIFSAIFSIFKK